MEPEKTNKQTTKNNLKVRELFEFKEEKVVILLS